MGKKPVKGKENATLKYAFVAVVVIAVVALGLVYNGFFEAPQEEVETSPFELESVKLLLGSFDRGAAIQEYYLEYSANENGVVSDYFVADNSKQRWAKVSGTFGVFEGFFSSNNSTDTLCLEYGEETRCARVGNDKNALDIAASLNALFPTPQTYVDQKDQVRKLISAGAIVVSPDVVDETVNGFDAQKIGYSLDYQNLTVQDLLSLGLSPNDPSLYTVTDQKVLFWIDKATGLVIKSNASFKENLVPLFFETEYQVVELQDPQVPEAPEAIIGTQSFVLFYNQAEQDFVERRKCQNMQQPDRDLCYKSFAVQQGDWELCKLVEDVGEYEACTLIVAQSTNNYVLCSKIDDLADDCYIAVAGETGNYGLCENLKDASLLETCTQAAVEGQKKVDEAQKAFEKLMSSQNCETDLDCKVVGNSNQYCVPKNATGPFANETSPMFSCLEDVPCSCVDGFCGFVKDDAYYKCLSEAENEQLQEFINNLVIESENSTMQTNNTTTT